MRFDENSIARLELPEGKRELVVFDDSLPGFGIRLREGGKKTWVLQYRIGRQQRRKTLGTPKELSLRAARNQAKADLAKVRLGGDPQKDKADARRRPDDTLESVAARFLRKQRSELKPRSFEQVELHLTKHWAPLKTVSILGIKRIDIANRLWKISDDRGPYAANRARATLSALYSWAIGEGLCDLNPTIGTNRNDERKRDRVLTDDELIAIWNACRDDDYGRIVRLLLLTGQRRDEVGTMARSEVDLRARKWILPGPRTKNNRTHEVPLSDAAIEVLAPAIDRAENLDRDLVFGEQATGFKGWGKAKLALDRRIAAARNDSGKTKQKTDPWRLHDLRRSAATKMAEIGIQPHIIESVLNHVSGHKAGVAGVYNLASYGPEKRQALALWTAHIEALLAGMTGSNIIPLKA